MGELPEEVSQEIQQLLKQRQLIGAVKVYRNETGSSLAEARDAVKQIQREMEAGAAPSEDGADSTARARGDDPVVKTSGGCFSVLLAIVAAAAAAWMLGP